MVINHNHKLYMLDLICAMLGLKYKFAKYKMLASGNFSRKQKSKKHAWEWKKKKMRKKAKRLIFP